MQRPTAANVVLPKRHIASTYDAKHNPEEKEVQYRQLVSRAVTQRLHSPSLSHVRFEDLHADTFEAWELRERLIARDKAILETEKLGITWGMFLFLNSVPFRFSSPVRSRAWLTGTRQVRPGRRTHKSRSTRPDTNAI
jgi:hypothetical protein